MGGKRQGDDSAGTRIRRPVERDVPMAVMLNKTDLPMKEVDENAARNLAMLLDCEATRTSAKTGENVAGCFNRLIEKAARAQKKKGPDGAARRGRVPERCDHAGWTVLDADGTRRLRSKKAANARSALSPRLAGSGRKGEHE